MKDLTLEMTTEELDRIRSGAERFGTITMNLNADDGTGFWLTVTHNTRKNSGRRTRDDKPPKVATAGANLGEPNGQPVESQPVHE